VALLTTGPADGAARINALFDGLVEAVERGDQRGCLLCSAAAGPSAVDADISKVVQHQLRKMGDAFHEALIQSVPQSRAAALDLSNLAGLLLSQYVGLRVMVRSNAPIDAIRHSTKALADILEAL